MHREFLRCSGDTHDVVLDFFSGDWQPATGAKFSVTVSTEYYGLRLAGGQPARGNALTHELDPFFFFHLNATVAVAG